MVSNNYWNSYLKSYNCKKWLISAYNDNKLKIIQLIIIWILHNVFLTFIIIDLLGCQKVSKLKLYLITQKQAMNEALIFLK